MRNVSEISFRDYKNNAFYNKLFSKIVPFVR